MYLKNENAFDAVAKLFVPPEKKTKKYTGVLAVMVNTLRVVKQSVPRALPKGLRSKRPYKQSVSHELGDNVIP